jgi:hypothetical protein
MSVRVLCHECFDYFVSGPPPNDGTVECPVCGNSGPVKTNVVPDREVAYYLEPRRVGRSSADAKEGDGE